MLGKKAGTTDPELEQIAAIARAGAGRSALYRWLRQRYDDFAELLEETRPNWAKLAEGFNALDMRTTDGKPLTAETVRHTWWRVRTGKAGGQCAGLSDGPGHGGCTARAYSEAGGARRSAGRAAAAD